VRVVFQIIGPTLTRKNVKFIGITTVNPNDSFVTPLVDAKFPDGRSVFLTLNFELICAECKKAGKSLQCRCLMADIPDWQMSTQHDKLALLMDQQTFLSEIKGMAMDETITPAFHQVSVEFLRSEESIMQSGDLYANEIYTAIDPAAGGKHSRFAIVSAIFVRDSSGRNTKMVVSSFEFEFVFFVVVVVAVIVCRLPLLPELGRHWCVNAQEDVRSQPIDIFVDAQLPLSILLGGCPENGLEIQHRFARHVPMSWHPQRAAFRCQQRLQLSRYSDCAEKERHRCFVVVDLRL
jgi:hypothetical protein